MVNKLLTYLLTYLYIYIYIYIYIARTLNFRQFDLHSEFYCLNYVNANVQMNIKMCPFMSDRQVIANSVQFQTSSGDLNIASVFFWSRNNNYGSGYVGLTRNVI